MLMLAFVSGLWLSHTALTVSLCTPWPLSSPTHHGWSLDALLLPASYRSPFFPVKKAWLSFPGLHGWISFLPIWEEFLKSLITPSPPPSTQILCLHGRKCYPFSTVISMQFVFAVSLSCSSQLLPQTILRILCKQRAFEIPLDAPWLVQSQAPLTAAKLFPAAACR